MRSTARARVGARLVALSVAALVPALACSNPAKDPPPECLTDEDCDEDLVCSTEQICVLQLQPPLPVLGFDIREGAFQIELTGCDPEVILEAGGIELRVQRRELLARNFELSVSTERSVAACVECTGECDDDELICVEPQTAQLDLTQASRFEREPLSSPLLDYTVPEEPLPEGELPTPVTINWPAYEADDAGTQAAAILDVVPPNAAQLRRVIANQSVEGPLWIVNEARCQRGIFGEAGAVRTIAGKSVYGATIEFVHDEAIAVPTTVLGAVPTSCSGDEQCMPGWACGPQGRCGLDLRGSSAGTTLTSAEGEPLVGGFASAPVYTYCEGVESTDEDPLVREFIVRLSPVAESGLPQASYRLAQEFPEPIFSGVPMTGRLCLPDWEAPQPVSFSIVGTPVELLENELGEYRCCSIECLPVADPDIEPTPPPMIESCSNFERIRFETRWMQPDEQDPAWVEAECLPTVVASDGSSGRFTRELMSCAEQPCSIGLTRGAADEDSRSYTVSIVQPLGSVFRSSRVQLELDHETTELEPFMLEPRVLLRGRIFCAGSDEDCNATDAEFAAERLRHPDEPGDALGPYYFQARVDAQGNFVLPIEPGVYVVTAFPAIGRPGGPAPLEILDLRLDSPLVEYVDGVPTVTLDEPFELDAGVLVRVLLRDFDVNTGVVPLDLGSWKSNPAFAEFDLDDTDTCYNTSSRRGCLIRRLRASDTPISLLLSKTFQFTARSGGPTKCPDDEG